MQQQPSVVVVCLICLGLSACVSTQRYADLEANLTQQLAQERQQRQKTEVKRQAAETQRDHYQAELSSLRSNNRKLEEKNAEQSRTLNRLAQETENLQVDVARGEAVKSVQKKIEQALQQQIEAQEIKLEEIEGKLKVTFVDKILFSTGSASINDKGQETLLSVANSLQDNPNQSIQVEGHTDNVPIRGTLEQRFPTNWELSVARATAVVRFLQEQGLLEPSRLMACGYSYYRPVASNDTEEGRSQNRRIEIILLPST